MSTFELLQANARTHVRVLRCVMEALEQDPATPQQLASCRYAARALQTMAQQADLYASADLVSTMEDFFSAAQFGYLKFSPEQVEFMFRLLDTFDDASQGLDNAGSRERSTICSSRHAESLRDTAALDKRVLVVDDSLAVRELSGSLLSARGYAVETAVDGIDGWNTVRAGTFDLVVADEDMPLVGGVRLVRLIRCEPRLQALPVVMAFDHEDAAAKRRAFEADADYYIAKSKLRDELIDTVASLIGSAQT